MNKFKKRVKEDRGAAEAVAFIMLLPVIMFVLFSFADMGVNFNIRNQMQTAAEGGARAVAIYGGTDTEVKKRYGTTKDLNEMIVGVLEDGRVKEEGLIPKGIMESKLVNNISVACFPTRASAAGEKVWCDITYDYVGLLNTGGYFNLRGKEITATGTSVSEVKPN